MTGGLDLPPIREVDAQAGELARRELDGKTKPRGSLGRLEDLAVRLASVAGTPELEPVRAAVVVAAADHGVAEEGVSAYPQEVTRQMLATFASGGAAICVLARLAQAQLVVVDAGVVEPYPHPAIRDLRLGPGTANAAERAAMSVPLAREAIHRGAALAEELTADGVNAVAVGDMGIGNTTAASALCAALLDQPARALCGPGTGLDRPGIERKVAVVERMLERHRDARDDPVRALAALGGFEIALLAGAMLGAAAGGAAVVLDGVVTGAAALVATRIAPALGGYLVAAHLSPEPAHAATLRALELEPLLDLRLRLGEGSGAALALPLLASARAILVEMATFEAAGVTDAGR